MLVECVLEVAKGYLGGPASLRSVGVEVFAAEQRGVVWAELRSSDLEAELRAVEGFLEVQDSFDGELGLELRFGDMRSSSGRAAAAKTLVLSR